MADPYDLDVSDVLEMDAVPAYREVCGAVSRGLIYLHTDLRLLEQIRAFRWERQGGPVALFGFLAHALLERGITVARRLWSDDDPDAPTLRRLRGLVRDHVRPEYADAVRTRLDRIDRDESPVEAFDRLAALRDRPAPHDTVGYDFEADPSAAGEEAAGELRRIADALGRGYNALTFGRARLFDDADLEPGWLSGRTGEMGHVLDLLVLHGKWSAAYDERPEEWADRLREELSEDELKELNRVRLQFGKPGIPLAPDESDASES